MPLKEFYHVTRGVVMDTTRLNEAIAGRLIIRFPVTFIVAGEYFQIVFVA